MFLALALIRVDYSLMSLAFFMEIAVFLKFFNVQIYEIYEIYSTPSSTFIDPFLL